MLKVSVISSAELVKDWELWGKTAIAVDVLRATTTIVAAFDAGCTECYPATSPDEARAMRRGLGDGALLGGERKAQPLEGFDLGNSPLEYTADRVAGRQLVITTSNGTAAIRRTGRARIGLIASLRNARATAEAAWTLQRDLVILCAGTGGRFSLEDTVGAGMIVDYLLKTARQRLALNDLATAAHDLCNLYGHRLLELLQLSAHGQYLVRLGHGADLEFCARANVSRLVPVYAAGVIRPGPVAP
ncbi:MAG: 2-phosphosulfolactate phosphatase [Bacillota bacterium]